MSGSEPVVTTFKLRNLTCENGLIEAVSAVICAFIDLESFGRTTDFTNAWLVPTKYAATSRRRIAMITIPRILSPLRLRGGCVDPFCASIRTPSGVKFLHHGYNEPTIFRKPPRTVAQGRKGQGPEIVAGKLYFRRHHVIHSSPVRFG